MDTLWMIFMSVSIVLKGATNAFPHAAPVLGAAGDTAFSLACLFANPQAALAALKGVGVSLIKPAQPAGEA
jgi:hypothetical protein